jgi:EmrB/QacA subfamily drug resistance transporter
MAQDLNESIDSIQWVLSGYLLAFSSMLIPAGNIGDRIGYRRTFLLGMVIFVATSAIIALAPNSWVAISARIAQGAGAALTVTSLYGLIAEVLPKKKQPLAISVIGGALGLGMSLGPTFGGFLIEYFSWSAIFWVNLPIGASIFAIIISTVPKSKPHHAGESMDWPGIACLIGGLSLILYGLGNVHIWGWDTLLLWGLLLSGGLLITYCIIREKSISHPLLHLHLFKNKHFKYSCILFTGFNYCFIAIVFIVGLLLQAIWEYTPFQAGLIMLAMTFCYGAFSPISGFLLKKYSPRALAVTGFLLTVPGLVWILYLPVNGVLTQWIIAQLLIGTGFALTFSSVNTTMISSLPEKETGAGSGLFLMFGLFSGALALVVTTAIAMGTLLTKLENLAEAQGVTLTDDQREGLLQVAQTGHFTAQQGDMLGTSLAGPMQELVVNHVHKGLNIAVILCVILSIAGVFTAFRGLKGAKISVHQEIAPML